MRTSSGRPRASSIADARAVAQPPEYSPAITDVAYRCGSIYLSIPLARLGVHPNAITVAWIALGLAGIAGLALDSRGARLAGALLLQFSYLLDYVDGEVARLQGRGSRVGEFLDLLGHGLHKATLPLAVAWTAAATSGAPGLLVAGVAGAAFITVGDALRFYAACVGRQLACGDLGHTARPRDDLDHLTRTRLLRSLFLVAFESPGLYALALVAAAADLWTPIALWWATAGLLWLVYRVGTYSARLARQEV